jgi:hypothetical protein
VQGFDRGGIYNLLKLNNCLIRQKFVKEGKKEGWKLWQRKKFP